MFDYLIVGAGFAGSVLAERLASVAGKKVLIIDKRNHIGGEAYDFYNEDKILVHKYGPRIFHTDSKAIVDYLSHFTSWRTYEHRVLASVEGQLLPVPINLNTINQFYGLNLCADDLHQFFMEGGMLEPAQRVKKMMINKIGKELYEKFFKGYMLKHWGGEIPGSETSTTRIPLRVNRDNRYYTDAYQLMPLQGYTKLFENMLSHSNIKTMLNTDYKEIADVVPHRYLIYTGSIDEHFNYCYGKLPYRSVSFKFETFDTEIYQCTGTINYPNDYPYTRVTEFKYLTGQHHSKTTVAYEYPTETGDPFYPVPTVENIELYKKYAGLAATMTNTVFTGRLGTYRYYNIDQVVAQSLVLFKKLMHRSAEVHATQPDFSMSLKTR